MIAITDLSFKYPDSAEVLENINLEVRPGESLGVIGPNGAGKSTLLLHLNGTLRIQSGAIRINQTPIDDSTVRAIRQKVGMVFQNPDDQLFMVTVFDDIAFGLLNLGLDELLIKEKIAVILARFGLNGFESKSPQHLSLGEKKKVALAGILVMQPEIMVFDEPTSSLDPRGRREFIELINGIPATKIIASHDLEMIGQLTQSVIILNHGRITAQGNTSEILSNKDLLRANGLV